MTAVLAQLADGVILTDASGRITFVNEAAERLHGVRLLGVAPADYSRAYALLTEAGEPYPPDELPLARAVLRGETVNDARWRIRRPDGAEVLALGSARPIRGDDGQQIGAMLTVRDDTERSRTEAALRETEARVLALTDNLPGAVVYQIATGPDGRDRTFLYLSPSFLTLTGVTAEAALADPTIPYEQILPEDRPALIAAEADAIREVKPFDVEARFRRADGEERWCRIISTPRAQPDGGLIWDGIQIDITDRKRAATALEGTTRRLDAIINNTRMAVFLMDDRQQCVFANAAAEALTGYRFEQMQGRPLHDVVHHKRPDGSPYPLEECPIDQAFPERAQMSGEELFVAPDGSFYPVAFTASPLLDEHGQPVGTVIEARNIAEEKAAEARLKQQTRNLETLNRTGAMIASELDLERLVQAVTDAGVELTGARFGAFFYNVLRADGERLMLYTLSGAERSAFERFGMPRPTSVFAPTFRGEGVIRSPDILVDPRYGTMEPHRGMPEGHLPVRSYLAVPVSSRSGEVIGGLFFGHPEPGVFESRHEELVVGLASQAAVAMDNARLFQAVQQANETLEARVAERTAERDRMWRLSTDLMLVASFDAVIEAVNPAWGALLGWADHELVGRPFLDFVHPDDLASTQAEAGRLASGLTTLRFENRYRCKSGEHRWVSWTAVPDQGFIHAVGRDVTAEKQTQAELAEAQEALRQSQKMEAVGQLTGGIAHDFNNMLAVVIGSLDLLSRRIDPNDARARRYAEAATEGARRAAQLTQRLLAFSRQQPLRPEAVNPNRLVAGMSDLLRHSLGQHVRLEIVLAGGIWRTHVDPNQLENVILNLAVNARDAMPEGGRLTIETQNAHLDHRYAAAHPGVAAGQYVLVAVSDTGSGMPPEVVAKAFDPFFTTKEVGKGTGLGLSQVYGFIKQSGGHVKIYSEVGQGTSIKVYLPRLIGDDLQPAEAEEPADLPLGDEQELILVVEDEPAVRQFSVDALTELGYRVLEADGAGSAIRLLESHPEIALMFTDVIMPDKNGSKLAQEAARVRPGLKVLFTTGYTRNAVVHNGILDPGVQLIGKPFTVEELAAKVREVLDTR
jgi:PAS domain S-box-containing protein